MVMTTTTGYILTIFGLFYSNFHNNDASILNHAMLNNYDDIPHWVHESDVMILDSGFCNFLDLPKALGIDAVMLPFLGTGRQQFDVYDTNRSRFMTKLRRVVEDVNVRLRRFKRFSQTIQNSLILSVPDSMAIVAALVNCFYSPVATSSPVDDETVRRMNLLLTQRNILQEGPFMIIYSDVTFSSRSISTIYLNHFLSHLWMTFDF